MKVKQKKTNKPMLSDKIADALTIKPRPDIEDDQIFNTKPNTVTRADFNLSESDDEATISDFRKRNVNLLSDISKKYEGKVVSRKELAHSSEESSGDENIQSGDESQQSDDDRLQNTSFAKTNVSDSSDNESFDYSITQNKKIEHDSEDEDDDNDDEGDSADDDDDEDGEGYDISQMEEPIKEQFEHVKKENVSEEAKKGACVRNQLLLWEGLLEMRIHMQRCINSANRMPMADVYRDLKPYNEFAAGCTTTISNVATALDKLLQLQNLLFKNFPETKYLTNNKNGKNTMATETNGKNTSKGTESDEEIPSDTDNEEIPSDTEPEDEPEEKTEVKQKIKTNTKKRKLEEFESDIASTYKNFKAFRDTTIQKWNEKTRVATVANIKNAPTNTILQQISYLLSDRQKLLRRTQLKRSEYDIIGYKKEQPEVESKEQEINPVTKDRKDDDEYIPEIFDDSDFYHQLLRELIECKSADISDPVQLSRQWIALQQMRSKMKRKVDTKATKGRKIKYVVHNKLVNYMAPEKSSKWNEESTTELYHSLFGKMFEQNNVGLNVDFRVN
ncbi:protein AATF [Aricia agestis]|uniref:protein AATF n=1 Tax=Aricia agestis TaxID=91739 RepID=UPI001C2032FA|nr:protein AATF [Aricia agestis]